MPSPVNLVTSCSPEPPAHAWPRVLQAVRLRMDWLWPGRCVVCGMASGRSVDLCLPCETDLPAPAPARPGRGPLASLHAAFGYAPPVDRLLPRLKFHGDLAAGRVLAAGMARALAAAPRPEALVPVPLHPARLRSRGYDQALELARPLARSLGLPLLVGALRRVRATAPQTHLDRHARRRNLAGAFRVRDGVVLPAHVALVDDVLTTGATLRAAATALRDAGVARVDGWACARAAPPRGGTDAGGPDVTTRTA